MIGTLGLRFFRNRLLVLDFVRQRLAIVDRGRRLPDDILDGVAWLPARYEHGYLFVPFVAAGRPIDDFFFDSGASAFPLTTTTTEWRALTGRADTDLDLVRYQVSSWGKQLTEIAAPLAGEVVFGPYRFARPLVFHQREQPDFFTSAPYHLGGHFGNALFFDRYVVIIDLPGRRFGLLSTRARPGPSITRAPPRSGALDSR